MANTTLDQWADSKRWIMHEKGLQTVWNELKQIINCSAGATGVALGTLFIDNAADAASTLNNVAARALSGQFNTAAPGTGVKSKRPDPGTVGGFGPTPTRAPAGNPANVPQLDGFRTS